ncbi:helix-turn-helix domain-containing protein [Actinocrispum sp. NPDC049592]|uniref:helix-turn-helix transcriptional regulator n=1 Tax=Actinocrispum sp. NPDC049592 TaxID=3154835 RepID=UPI0034443E52
MGAAKSDRGLEMAQLLTVVEMLEILDVSRDTFYKWRQTGKGPRCFTLPNGELRCMAADFAEWLTKLGGAA